MAMSNFRKTFGLKFAELRLFVVVVFLYACSAFYVLTSCEIVAAGYSLNAIWMSFSALCYRRALPIFHLILIGVGISIFLSQFVRHVAGPVRATCLG